MEHLLKIQKQIDNFAHAQPELVKVCKKYNVPPGYVVSGLLAVLTLLGIMIQGYNIICALLTCVYPMI